MLLCDWLGIEGPPTSTERINTADDGRATGIPRQTRGGVTQGPVLDIYRGFSWRQGPTDPGYSPEKWRGGGTDSTRDESGETPGTTSFSGFAVTLDHKRLNQAAGAFNLSLNCHPFCQGRRRCTPREFGGDDVPSSMPALSIAGLLPEPSVFERTGPGLFTRAVMRFLRKHPPDPSISIFPADVFYPLPSFQRDGEDANK